MTAMTRARTHPRLLILAALTALGPMSIDMYLPSLPAIQADLGAAEATTQLTLAAYFVGLALGQLFYGPISDALGRKTPLLFGLTLYTAASAGCLLAPNVESLILLRLLQALGGCAGIVITRAIVRDCYAPQEMARVLSTLMMIMGVAPVLAPLAGSYVYDAFGWRATFGVLVAYGGACITAVSVGIPETNRAARRVPSLRESLRDYARLMRHRRFMGYALAGSIAQAGLFAYISASAFVLIQIYGISPKHYAWIFGVNAFGLIAASQLNSLALRRLPVQRVLRRALLSYASFTGLMLASAITGIGGLAGLLVPLFFGIASLGFSFPNSTAAAMAPFGDRAGMAAALLGTLQFALASLSSFVVGHVHDGTAVPMAAVITACAFLGLAFLHKLVRPPASTGASSQ